MDLSLSTLSSRCKEIESLIEAEKKRLQQAKEQLASYTTNERIEEERLENEKRESKIKLYHEKVQELRDEITSLRTRIVECDREKSDLLNPMRQKKRSLNVVSAEVDNWDFEIGKLDKEIQKMKNTNVWTQEENRRKLEEFQVNCESVKESRSTSFQKGRLRAEEDDAKKAVGELKKTYIKAEDQLHYFWDTLMNSHTQCLVEESKIDDIIVGLEELKKVNLMAMRSDITLNVPSDSSVTVD